MNLSKLFAVQLLADAFYKSGRVTHRNPGGDGSEPLAGDRQAAGNLQRVNHAVKLQGSDADTMSREPSPD
jgi:hypothetical protein